MIEYGFKKKKLLVTIDLNIIRIRGTFNTGGAKNVTFLFARHAYKSNCI